MRFERIQQILALPFSWRQHRVSRYRTGIWKVEFVQLVQIEGGDGEAACLIRDKLLDWVYVPGFTPHPDDKFGFVYGMTEEERDVKMILEVFLSLKLSPPSGEALKKMGEIETPLRLAQVVGDVRLGLKGMHGISACPPRRAGSGPAIGQLLNFPEVDKFRKARGQVRRSDTY